MTPEQTRQFIIEQLGEAEFSMPITQEHLDFIAEIDLHKCEHNPSQNPDPTKRPVIEVNSTANFEFWVGMFRPRTDKWKRETLRRLKKGVSPLETPEENADKIKALQFLLG